MTATTTRGHLTAVPDAGPGTVTVLPVETEPDWDTPLTADSEDANAAAYSLEAEVVIQDAFERALDRLKRGDPLQVIVADAVRVGVFHGYGARLTDERVSAQIADVFQLEVHRNGGGSA